MAPKLHHVGGLIPDGHREILGVDCFTTEDGAGWTASLRGLVARGLSGVALVVSDAHEGLKNAIEAVLLNGLVSLRKVACLSDTSR